MVEVAGICTGFPPKGKPSCIARFYPRPTENPSKNETRNGTWTELSVLTIDDAIPLIHDYSLEELL
jgi:hypothetical protein